MDNFYNSPALAQRLKTLKTDCVGTRRLSRKDVPQRVKEKKLKKGELLAQHSGPVSFLKWTYGLSSQCLAGTGDRKNAVSLLV